jgi:mannitol/fructose-specific phosphotransferase system IIA component (Ntr-type)
MKLSRYVRPEFVLTDLAGAGLDDVLHRVATHLGRSGAVPEGADVETALRVRELAHTTAMGHGMALPHATIDGLAEPVLGVAIAPAPIAFGPPDTEPVDVFFVLLSPPGRESDHIKLLARICRLVRHPGFMDALREAETAADAVAVIERVDHQHV